MKIDKSPFGPYRGLTWRRLSHRRAIEEFGQAEEPAMSSAVAARKERSEGVLAKEGGPFIAHLPVIEDESEASQRTKESYATE